jgi:hypothetical protein
MPGNLIKWKIVTVVVVTMLLAACGSGGTVSGDASPSPSTSALCQDVVSLHGSVSNLTNIHVTGNTVNGMDERLKDVQAKLAALQETAQGTWRPQSSMLQGALTRLEGQLAGMAGDNGSASGVSQALGRVRTAAQRLFNAARKRCPQL